MLTFHLGGITLYADPRDLILPPYTFPNGTVESSCYTGVQPGGELSILGDVWLKSVVAVFDVGAAEMRFAAHNY